MTDQERIALIEDSIKSTQELISAIEFSLSLQKNSIVSHGWIVVDSKDQTSAYSFDTTYNPKSGRYDVSNPRWDAPHRANRLTKEDAVALAPNMANGNGPLRAVHWMDAAEEMLDRQRDVLATWNTAMEKVAA